MNILLLFFAFCGILLNPLCHGLCRAEENPMLLTLSNGLKIATENNRLVRIAARGRDIVSADVLIARARYLPSVNASLSQTFLAERPNAIFGALKAPVADRSSFAYGFNVQQILYDFGARSSLHNAAVTALDTADLEIGRARNIAALDFVISYFDLLETEKMELVGQREVERLNAHRSTAQDLYKEGTITKNDLLQAEVRLSDARQRLLTTENLRAINEARINNILSLPLRNSLRVVDVTGMPSYEADLHKAWDIAERQRVELKTIERELEIIELEKAVKRSEYFPVIFAQGGYNYTENHYVTPESNWALILGLTVNLFNGGGTKAEIAKIDYRKGQILEQRQKLVDDIALDVEKSYFDMKNAGERIKVTRDARAQAEENLKINRVRYREGIGTSTDVLDAITLLTTAETNYYRAEYEFRRAQGAFMYATGADLVKEYK